MGLVHGLVLHKTKSLKVSTAWEGIGGRSEP